MEVQQLTVWEQKERDGLLSLETDEWRQKRLIAEDPNAIADVLERFAEDALKARRQTLEAVQKARNAYARAKRQNEPLPQRIEGEPWKQSDLLLEALAAHPNTPPRFFSRLIGATLSSAKAFCRNPVTPFLLLERPSFLSDLGLFKLVYLLSEADASLLFVRLVVAGNITQVHSVREAARLHVALAGAVSTVDEWRRQVTEYWQKKCDLASQELEDKGDRQWYADLVEMELAPAWANGTVEPPTPEQALSPPDDTDAIVDEWLRFDHTPGSVEEAALLLRIGKRVEDKALVARGLGGNAKPADMIELLQAPGSGTVILCRALLRHPFVTGDVIRAMPLAAGWYDQQLIAIHPKTPIESVTHLCQDDYPDVRRLARRHPNAPADAVALSRAAFLDNVRQRTGEAPPTFGMFVACLYGATKSVDLPMTARSGHFTQRLGGVLQVEVADEPLPGDPYQRTGRDLLNHFARDGNRLVRWAAQTRLADPDFVFTWHEDAD